MIIFQGLAIRTLTSIHLKKVETESSKMKSEVQQWAGHSVAVASDIAKSLGVTRQAHQNLTLIQLIP